MRYLFSLLFLFSSLYSDTLSLKTLNAEKRVAYVIGNGDYDESPLSNAVSDSLKMKAFLEKYGFDVTYAEDAGKRDIIKGLRDFNSNMQADGIALFYFSGHMIQVKGSNYLIPIEAAINSDYHVLYEAIELDAIISKMQKNSNRLNIIIIDSAFENPFGNKFRAKVKGLAPFKKHDNTDIILSVGPNKTSKHYNFSSKLITVLSHKGVSNKEGFKTFNSRYKKSHIMLSKQEFFFNTPDSLESQEDKLWKKAAAQDTPDGYNDYVAKFPTGKYIKQANLSLGKLEKKAEDQRNKDAEAKAQKLPAYIEPEMVLIKSGNYIMGSNSENKDESPAHLVHITRDFYMGRYEVTNAEYNSFLMATDKKTNPIPPEWTSDKQPVVNISWKDATAYAAWLSEKTGKTYRLPREEEWEYAARAGITTPYYWGDKSSDTWRKQYPENASVYAWIKTNSQNISHDVGTQKPNIWGLYDVIGNVWEWCSTTYTQDYNTLPEEEKLKVMRGGSWFSTPDEITLSHRGSNLNDFTSYNIGFRLLLEK